MSEGMIYAKTFFALLFVVGLIFACAALAKKAGLDRRLSGSKGGARRLSVSESLYLDPRHRVVIVESGEREYVLLLGTAGDLLIESRPKDGKHA